MVQPIRRSWCGLISVGCAALSGCGSAPAEPVGSSEAAIVGGQIATDHESVFGLVIHRDRAGATCTATLIAPNLLLTARHCIAPSEQDRVVCGSAALGQAYPAEDLYASNAVEMRAATRWFRGASVHVPTEGNDTCGYDVALVVLRENVSASVATPAVPRIDREVEAGESYVAVGYGVDEKGDSGSRMVRRDLQVDCSPGTCGSDVRTSEFRGDSGICEGDSGGPAFDADGKVVGIVSRGAEPCEAPVYGTVTAWKDLITSVALSAAARGGYTAPFWARSGVSDPDVAPVPGGRTCSRAADCGDGLACYQTSDESPATCVARCTRAADCGGDLECRSVDDNAAQLCLPARDGEGPGSSCALGVPGVGRASSGLWLAAAALASLWARRKRR